MQFVAMPILIGMHSGILDKQNPASHNERELKHPRGDQGHSLRDRGRISSAGKPVNNDPIPGTLLFEPEPGSTRKIHDEFQRESHLLMGAHIVPA